MLNQGVHSGCPSNGADSTKFDCMLLLHDQDLRQLLETNNARPLWELV